MAIADAGQSGSGVVTGTAMHADNTARDWTEAAEIGASTVGAVAGSILSFGTAAAPLAVASAALDAAAIGANAYKDVEQNKADSQAQQRSQQGALDAQQARFVQTAQQQNGHMGSGQALRAAANPMAGAQVDPAKVNQMNIPKAPVEQSPTAMNVAPGADFTGDAHQFDGQDTSTIGGVSGTGISDRRAKKNIASGNADAEDFLAMARARCWPKGMK